MEKINKEELMKKLSLTEEELDEVVGGGWFTPDCDEVRHEVEKYRSEGWGVYLGYIAEHPYNVAYCDIREIFG